MCIQFKKLQDEERPSYMFGLPIDAELKILLNKTVVKVGLDTLDAEIKDTVRICYQNDFDLVKCLL